MMPEEDALKQDSNPIAWLLDRDQPAVRALTLTGLLHQKATDADVRQARAAVPKIGWAAQILDAQLPGGFWDNSRELNRPKYLATFWKFLILCDLGVTLEEPRMRQTCDLLVARASRPDGWFSFWDESHFCMTGQIAGSLLRLGYPHRRRVFHALDWIAAEQKRDGGCHCFPSEKGTLDCWQGLSAFAALPRNQWTSEIQCSADRGSEFYLKRGLLREGRVRYNPWFRLHSPTHYFYDFLVGLEVLTALGYEKDARLARAVRLLKAKRRVDGRWAADRVHPDVEGLARRDYHRFEPRWPVPFSLESAGKPSKLITLRAMRVLQRVEGKDDC